MTLEDAMEVMTGPDRIRILKGETEIYAGFLGTFTHTPNWEKHLKEKVIRIRENWDIRHKRYKELGLMPPIHPEQTPNYSFSDLQITAYREIILESED